MRTSTVTTNHQGIMAIRSGDWKWIEGVLPDEFDGYGGVPSPPANEARPQLYNLRESLGETTEVSFDHPEVVEELRQKLYAIRGY